MINRAQDLGGIRQTLDISAQRMSHLLIQKTQLTRFNLEQVDRKLKSNIDLNLSKSKREFAYIIALLNAYSPLNSLERGYSLTYKDQSLVQSIQQVQKEDILKIRLKDGNIQAKVVEIGEKI
jgi:exodeoxyribonuclease VII large subunit